MCSSSTSIAFFVFFLSQPQTSLFFFFQIKHCATLCKGNRRRTTKSTSKHKLKIVNSIRFIETNKFENELKKTVHMWIPQVWWQILDFVFPCLGIRNLLRKLTQVFCFWHSHELGVMTEDFSVVVRTGGGTTKDHRRRWLWRWTLELRWWSPISLQLLVLCQLFQEACIFSNDFHGT